MDLDDLKHDLKQMIIEECEKEDILPQDIANDTELFSDASGLELDSLDALQISMGLQNKYGIRVGDPKEFRRVVTTTNSLAEFVNAQKS